MMSSDTERNNYISTITVENPNNRVDDTVSSKRSRKRVKDESTWKENVRKRLRQSGQAYVNAKGKQMRSRKVKTSKDCQGKCRYKCSKIFSAQLRKTIFDEFWSLTDSEKNTYYDNTTDKIAKERQRTTSGISRRQYTLKYYLVINNERVRVCREFYTGTLDISAKRIEYFYKKFGKADGLNDHRGRARIPKLTAQVKAYIREHIKSFPRVPLHYCRASTTKEYLEPDLSVSKMHRLYSEKCLLDGVKAETENAYRKIFNKDFNLAFHKPKKDRCDTCEEFKVSVEKPPILVLKHERHIQDKELTDEERENDRKVSQPDEMVICFDMQNVITCPRSNISNFFYKRKLNVYNMTGHCSLDKFGYNVIWNEQVAGRGSNELASAVMIILEHALDKHPDTKKITLWSDSCMPQNWKSMMALALKIFQQKHPEIVEMVQKFCTPGHSTIQEIDNIHSHIEKKLRVSEIYSPLSLIRKLKQVLPDQTIVIQLGQDMIYDYRSIAKKFSFKEVPFSKAKALRYVNGLPFKIFYKESFSDEYTEVTILKRTRASGKPDMIPLPKTLKCLQVLSEEKKKDIESMLRFMPAEDCMFMKSLCKIGT